MFSKYLFTLFLSLISCSAWAVLTLPITVQTEYYRIVAQPTVIPIPINQIHTWRINIEDLSGSPVEGLQLQVTGGMPAHQHGLPTQPQLIDEPEPGEYLIDGLKFHMHGKWYIELDDLNSKPPFHHRIEFELEHVSAQ